MSGTGQNILLIDDDPNHSKALAAASLEEGYEAINIMWVRSLSSGLERLAEQGIWAIFLNLFLPDSHGVDTLDRVMSVGSSIPVVVLGGVDDRSICKVAMLHGAQDYLLEGHIDAYAFARAIRKICERELVKQEFFTERNRAQITLNSIGDAVLSTDDLGNVNYLNAGAERMTGWTLNEAVGHPLKDVFQIIDADTHEPFPSPADYAIRENKTLWLSENCILVRRDGHECAIEDSVAPIYDREGHVTGAVIVFHDVSMTRSLIMEMSHSAQHDALTNLPNRLVLRDRLTQAISLARRNDYEMAVLFLDLDGFKNINDSLGHSVGDALLQAVAVRLLTSVRRSDTVSRQGGDEFVILLPEIAKAEGAAISAEKILNELKRPHVFGEHSLLVTGSIGISTFPDHGDDAETMIKNADTAMYYAKQHGTHSWQFYEPNMSLQAVERQSLEGQLRYALEREELLLHYQPKVNLKTGDVTSVEALLRWQHPQRGLLLPQQFLAIAEDTGMIVGIGNWVLREACRQMREWLDAGLRAVPVAVNVSSLEFRSEHFLEGVQAALKNTRLDPKYLELELTETALMEHAESTIYALQKLKSIGVRLAVDDFGTGYSSLSYLTRFPIDALKLDQSFLRNLATGSDGTVIVKAVVAMGQGLNHRVIAEGVETLEQLAFLQANGCDEGQGYHFSRPVAPQQFAKLLETGILECREGHDSITKA